MPAWEPQTRDMGVAVSQSTVGIFAHLQGRSCSFMVLKVAALMSLLQHMGGCLFT